jgi:hypothetical protein
MAKYIDVPAKGMFTYALDECEDYVLLNAYLRIVESGKFKQSKYVKVFEYYHLQEGGTLNDNILMQINGSLRLLGRPSLAFVNGHTTNYASLRGQEKVARRQEILDQLCSLDAAERTALVARKETEAAKLPERNYAIQHRPIAAPGGLSRAETELRRAALANAQKKEAGQQTPGSQTPFPPSTSLAGQVNPEPERESVPESTIQDNVVELIAEMHDLRSDVASLKAMLQAIFKNI